MRALGLEAGHEVGYNLSSHAWNQSLDVEASWLAVPHLGTASSRIHVVHQVRNPLNVVRSFVGFGFFERAVDKPYRDFIFKHAPEVIKQPDAIDKSMMYWLAWNRRTQVHAESRHQLEQLDAVKLQTLVRLAGRAVTVQQVVQVMAKVGNKYNTRPRADLTNSEILSRPLGARIHELAAEYGY